MDQKSSNIKIVNRRNENNNQLVDIRLEINKMYELISKKKITIDRIELSEDIQLELEQDNVDKVTDVKIEKNREECELIEKC